MTADSFVEARIEPQRLTLDVTTVYNIERAGVFKLEMDLPAGFEVRDVRGCYARSSDMTQGAGPADVDSHRLEGEKKDRLVVQLARKAMGRVALAVRLQKDLQERRLLTPSGQAAEIPLPLPRTAGVESASGRLMVYAPKVCGSTRARLTVCGPSLSKRPAKVCLPCRAGRSRPRAGRCWPMPLHRSR